MHTLKRILVPVDFSPCSRAAVEYALFLAERFDATVDVLHVWQEPQTVWEPMSMVPPKFNVFAGTRASAEMKAFLSEIEETMEGIVHGRLECGDPYRTILEMAGREHYDLLVLGTHGRTGMTHLLLGSLAESVVRKSPCPVLTVRDMRASEKMIPSGEELPGPEPAVR
jgi:nucleotide-binding universal stress UspA family protein